MNDIYKSNLKLFAALLFLLSSVSVLNIFNYILVGNETGLSILTITKWDIIKPWYYAMFSLISIIFLNFLLKNRLIIGLGYMIAVIATSYLAIMSNKIVF